MHPTHLAIATISAGVIAAGISGWVGYRLYLRKETLAELRRTKYVRTASVAEYISQGLGIDLGIPTPEELAEALVPIWDYRSPYEAVEDVLRNGRGSAYWPAAYRESGDVAALEPALFEIARRLYEGDASPPLLQRP